MTPAILIFMNELDGLTRRIKELTGWNKVDRPRIVTDTTNCMDIRRGDILRFDNYNYVIRGNRYETRFGIADQPKYWVFGAIDLDSGKKKIIKTVFHEEFKVRIGIFKIRCFRSPEKEGDVLRLVKGDSRFMQGFSLYDEKKNNVRIIDYINGETLLYDIIKIKKDHEQYFYEDLPKILKNLLYCIEAINLLHENDLCHGDIRNDHIIIDNEDNNKYRWIDFDLKQNLSDFDVWSIGNIINYAVGKGINPFQKILKSKEFSDEQKNSLGPEDASAFYEYRLMNLKKIYPYIPETLGDILMHFVIKPEITYTKINELLVDYRKMLDTEMSGTANK
jgi:serine/threonine protein kinase